MTTDPLYQLKKNHVAKKRADGLAPVQVWVPNERKDAVRAFMHAVRDNDTRAVKALGKWEAGK